MDYKYLPLLGLLSIKKEEISNASIFDAISYAEERINSSPKGRVTELALLFYLISILNDIGLAYFVKGGVILNYYLKDKVRPTHDLDIIIDQDPDLFFEEIKKYLSKINNIKIIEYSKTPADRIYYYDTFSIELEVSINGEKTKTSIDGIYNHDIYQSVDTITYDGPEFIKDNLQFQGVHIEYVLAEKIMAISNELLRPFKHLVDVYSLIHTDIDTKLLNNYLSLIKENDDKVRKNLNIDINDFSYQIKENKPFVGNFTFTALQSGQIISLNEMIDAVNKWLEINIK